MILFMIIAIIKWFQNHDKNDSSFVDVGNCYNEAFLRYKIWH